jgi:zinc protease
MNLKSFSVLIVALTVAAVSPIVSQAANVKEITSPGGIKAWLVEEKSIPIISMEVVWKGGATIVGSEKAGLSYLVASTMDEGAGELDSQTFQKRLNDLAISLSFDAGKEAFSGSLKTLSANKDEAFRLFSLAITSPRFDDEPVERIRKQILIGLNRKKSNPNNVAGRAWYKLAFGDHPYSVPTNGYMETVSKLNRTDLLSFKNKQIARDNMVISVVGDIDAETLKNLLDKTFSEIAAKADIIDLPDVNLLAQGQTKVIPFDIPQSIVMFGGPGVTRDDPDYYAAYVLNYILGGGGFESRLTTEIREKRGLVYSVYSYLSPYQKIGLHMGGFGTSNATAGEALKLAKQELAKIRNDGVTAEELVAAKTYINGSFPLRLSSNSNIANIAASMQLHGLPIEYLEKRSGYIDAVSNDDILRVAKRLMDPDKLIITVVGKPEGL